MFQFFTTLSSQHTESANFMEIIPLTIIIILILGFFRIMFSATSDFTGEYILRNFVNRYFLIRPIKQEHLHILERKSLYYKNLNAKNKMLFAKRVGKFIAMKKFVAKGDLKDVTDEMKTLIAASAIKITFGYPAIYFQSFWKILIYPDEYFSTITKKRHHGEINLRGLMVFSWKRFKEGYDNYEDGINLALHEMAHALIAENRTNNFEFDFLNNDYLQAFDKLFQTEKEKILKENNSFFRNYAATNEHEFFSVVVENFFERPEELYSYNPNLYKITSKILRQDLLKNQN